MFGIKKLFKRTTNEAAATLAKLENKDMMEAVVAGSILLIFADGNPEESEFQALKALINANEKLSHFGVEIDNTIDRFQRLMLAGANLGRIKVMQEIKDCKYDGDDAIEIFAVLLDVAQADGEVSEPEVAVLKAVGRELNVPLSMFGMEG